MNTRIFRFQIQLFAVLMCFGVPAWAYDAETYALITFQAYRASLLFPQGAGSTSMRLGLDRLDAPLPFNAYWLGQPDSGTYYDNTTTFDPTQTPRHPDAYEQCQMVNLLKAGGIPTSDPMVSADGKDVSFLPIQNWLMRGVLREDDLNALLYFTIGSSSCGKPRNPDPYGQVVRVLNHFYDPINDVPLNAGVFCGFAPTGQCLKSVDWALGVVDSFAMPQVVDTNRRNHFTYADARENMWRALTGERNSTAPAYTGAVRESDARERLYRWATTFRSLGDTIHLLQDGASPQHVRNDPHSGTNTQEQQAFEGYTNARVLKKTSNDAGLYVRGFFAPPFAQTLPDIELGAYPVPKFATPVRFYTTRLKGDGPGVLPDNRYGMMDYANRSFFTGGTLPGMNGNTFQSPPSPIDGAHDYTQSQKTCVLSAAIGGNTQLHNLKCTHWMHAVVDSIASTYPDVLPAVTPAFTAPPLAAESAFRFTQVAFSGLVKIPQYTVGLEELDTMANLGVPRAIGYSAGLLNYFFRGQLTLTSAPDKVVGVLNQGAKHTMNAQGYPCVGTATTDGCVIFGFQSVRVNVQNTTPQITESGTGTVIPQNLSATAVGSVTDPAFHGPYLVAVAKYHRNTCYKPDLSGERQQSYSVAIPTIEPTCSAGQVVRTAYQEISVSKSAAVTAAVLNGTTASEVHFDFSSDPIPVNATDLFIQVVYRGPMGDATLGQEADAIAVGTLDVREPTFASFWNNTDSWWNESIWGDHNSIYPQEGVRDFWVCGGTFPPKLLFEYYGALTGVAMVDAVGSNVPGQVRLGILFPPPDVPGQGKILRGTPVTYPGVPGTQQIPVRSPFVGSGAFRQANLENVLPATLSAPYVNCGSSLPVTSQFWCFDTIQKRRGQLFGATAQPLYLETPFGGTPPTDVDAAGLAAYAGTTPLALGTLRFDTDTTLLTCPSQPTITGVPPDREHIRQIELLEEARSLGVSGEEEPPLQQRQ